MAALHPETAARDPLASRVVDLARIERITHGTRPGEPRTVHVTGEPAVRSIARGRCCRSRCRPTPNTSRMGDGTIVLWLGPDEWLILAPRTTGERPRRMTANQLSGDAPSVRRRRQRQPGRDQPCRVPGASTCWREAVRSTCIRVHGAPGCVRQTLLGKAQVILFERTEATTTVLVRTSFADYLVEWLLAPPHQLDPPSTADGIRLSRLLVQRRQHPRLPVHRAPAPG